MILTKSFSVEVKNFDERSLNEALEAMRVTILDFALELKTTKGKLLDEANLLAETTKSSREGFSSEVFSQALQDPVQRNKMLAMSGVRPTTRTQPKQEEPETTVVDDDDEAAFEDDQPRVIARPVPVKTVQTTVQSGESIDDLMSKIFKEAKKTAKSAEIVEALLKAGDEGMSVAQLSAKLRKEGIYVSSWFNSCVLPCVERIGRGVYRINKSKI